jgi:hypothetical protein
MCKTPRKGRLTYRLSTLLATVAICALVVRFRPGHADPREVKVGTSKAWILWACGSKAVPIRYDRSTWFFEPAPESDETTVIVFDGNDRVEAVIQWPRSLNGFWEGP